jgi:hypothetical protein
MIYTRRERLMLRTLSLASYAVDKPSFLAMMSAVASTFRPRSRRMLRAVHAWFDGEVDEALEGFALLASEDPDDLDAVHSLGYALSSRGSPERWERAARCLNIDAPFELQRPVWSMLRLDVALKVGAESAVRRVETEYLDRLVRPRIQQWAPQPIFFWHIPKCSGTSVSHAVGQHFYGVAAREVVPHYTALHLLQHCVGQIPDAFPFLSSRHVDSGRLDVPAGVFEFTVLRDPVKRVLSSWRQSHAAIARTYHYRLLPRYGHDWFFWPPPSLPEWLARAPAELALAQLVTFATSRRPDDALERLERVEVISYDLGVGDFDAIMKRAGVPLMYTDLPRKMNRSPERPSPSALDLRFAREFLASEYSLMDGLSFPSVGA